MIDVNVEFERECYKCHGASRFRTSTDVCRPCQNTGYVSNELGERLIEFLEHHKVRESRNELSTTEREG